MNTIDALEARRSVRGYLDKPVEEDKLKLILKYGNKAPNAGPFHMTVITNRDMLDAVDAAAKEAGLASGDKFTTERFSIPGYRCTYGAPVLIILSAPEGGFSSVNVACAATNMGVAAVDQGLASCYLVGVLMAFRAKPELLEKLELPEGYVPQCGLILGYQGENEIPGITRNSDLSNVNYLK
ncbi:MAG: nitroreductase family protein [Clostridiales bacterium]|nr:nitroreductase family protein [Clostridiales bacterium]